MLEKMITPEILLCFIFVGEIFSIKKILTSDIIELFSNKRLIYQCFTSYFFASLKYICE